MHHSDFPFEAQDLNVGDICAEVMGDLFIDCSRQSPVEQWRIVMKALRLHGFVVAPSRREVEISSKLIDAAEDGKLDDIVIETAEAMAASINNSGVEGQISFLRQNFFSDNDIRKVLEDYA